MEPPNSPLPSRRPAADFLPNEQEISYDYIRVFFNRNKPWIVGLSLLVILAVVGAIAWRFQENQVRHQAETRLAKAFAEDSIDSLNVVAKDFLGTDAALIAVVILADNYFQQGQWDKAATCYQTLVDRYPSSPLAPSAFIGLAAVAEAGNKMKEAVQTYKSIATNFPDSFQAPQAQFAAARLEEYGGQLQEARKSYEELIAKYPKSSWKNEATIRLQKIDLQMKVKPVAAGT